MTFFMAFSKLEEAMAIYLVKQACGNDKLACVYLLNILTWPGWSKSKIEWLL